MADLRIDADRVIDSAGKIGTLNSQMRDSFTKVESAVRKLDGAWDGIAAGSAMGKFNAIKNTFCEARYTVLDNYVAFLHNQVGVGYQQTETANKNLASWFK